MAPRPIVLVIAEELSPVPTAVLEEHRKIMALEQPSRASDDAPVRNNNESATKPATHADPPLALLDDDEEDDDDDDIVEVESPAFTQDPKTESALSEKPLTNDEGQLNTPASSSSSQEQPSLDATVVTEENEEEQSATAVESTTLNTSAEDDDIVEVEGTEENSKPAPSAASDVWAPQGIVEMPPTLREEEDRILGNKEILFEQDASACYNGWDTLRWMSYSGARNISFSQTIYRRFDGVDKRKRKGGIPLFWKTGNSGTRYESRFLIAYDDPSVILIVRPPESIEEIQQILGLSELGASMAPQQDGNDPLESFWVLESVIEPAFCKLRLSALTTPTSIPSNTATYDCAHRERSCFELITPSETIVLSVVDVRPGAKKKEQSFTDSGAFLETFSAETSIAQFICEAHSHHIEKNEDDNHNNSRGPVKDISWKHQVIIGSLHSLVLSGNIKALEEGIIYAKESYARTDVNADPNFLPTRIVDALDDNGYSPIYYACSRHQLHPAVRALVQAGANATYQSEVDGTTLLHIAAQNLDDKTLCTLLSASHPRRPDPNVVDKHGRTPMYVAMVKGSFMDGGKDPPGLGRCIASLKAWGGKLLVPGNKLRVRNPINALATMWLPDYLTVVFDGHVPFRFPLESNECLDCGPVTISLGALYEYPVHSAILSLRKQVRKQKFTDSFAIESSLVRTLRVLFEHGFEQNERLDRGSIAPIKMSTEWAQELTEFVGYSPLQILAYIALELDATKEGTGRKVHERCMQLVSETAEFLVKNGARLSMEPPLTARRRQEGMPSPSNTDEVVRVELLSKKIESDDHLLNLLGGKERLLLAKKEWEQLDKVSTMCTNVLDEYKEAFEESTSGPGGSDSLSCAICWSEFGAFVNRKHKCRVSRKFVCDDCSSKRLVQVSTEYRLSDGQFLLARVDAARERDATTMAKEEAKTRNSEHARAAARLDRLEAEEKASRDSLFSGFVERATNFVMGDENEKSSTSRQIEGLSSTLNQTRDALNQRGEKLATLNDKSAQLVDASANFAQMATELRKKSEKGIFGW
jgi:DNA-directed RNA polymerase subunit RPC12/RpoP